MNISQVLTKLKALIYSKSETDSLLGGKANSSHTHTKSQITDFPSLATVATSGSYSDLSNKPSSMTPSSHSHGNITNAGAIGTTANKPLITTTNGAITTGSFGTTANTFCQGNDSRLSDARTPTSHTHTKSQITDFPTIPSKTSQLTNDSGFLTSHQSLANYVTSSNLSTALSDKVDRIDHGYKQITGNGTYSWCKLATITIKGGYINNPISFEVDGRGRERSILQVLFANVSNNDPSLTSFKSDLDTNFYIKKVATSTWELYGNYSEAWGSFTLYRVTSSINSNSVAIDTTLSNLSSAPSGTTRVSLNISVPTKTSQLTNDSGFLTSHQSLSNYLAKYTGVSEMGRSIDLHYDNATAARDYDVRLYVDSQTTSNGGGSFKISAGSVYTPNNLYLGSYRVYVG